MKFIKTTSLLSLLGLLALTSPQNTQAGGPPPPTTFPFPPFGRVTLNIKMSEPQKGGPTRQGRFDTAALMQLIVDAMNQNEGFALGTNLYVLPATPVLWFDGFDFHIRGADGSGDINITDS